MYLQLRQLFVNAPLHMGLKSQSQILPSNRVGRSGYPDLASWSGMLNSR